MGTFTKALRQKIVTEFATRHNGTYNPSLFVEEVRRTGSSHPAYAWFEWDQNKAALAHQVEQARDFARDLRVTFTVQVVNGGKRSVKVRETAMPLVLSPMDGRRSGGGYLLVNPDDPAYMAEHAGQAAQALRSWWSRYESAAEHVGINASDVEAMIAKLETATAQIAA